MASSTQFMYSFILFRYTESSDNSGSLYHDITFCIRKENKQSKISEEIQVNKGVRQGWPL
jgi:hypothetical protein